MIMKSFIIWGKHHVVCWKLGDVLEECGISIFRVEANQETNMKYATSSALQYEFRGTYCLHLQS